MTENPVWRHCDLAQAAYQDAIVRAGSYLEYSVA